MYKVNLTTKTSYQNLKSYEIWKTNPDYFIFYWSDKTYIIIKKEYVISIQKTE